MDNKQVKINKPIVLLMALNTCLASLYLGYNLSTYNSAAEVIITLNGWRGKDEEILYPSLITSSLAVGCIITSPIAVVLLKLFKNNLRKVSMFVDLMTIVACVVQLVDTNVANLIIGRFLAGCIGGLNCTYVSSFLAEISPVDMRGITGFMNQLFIVIGILTALVLGVILPSKADLIADPFYDNQIKWRIVVGLPVIFTLMRYFFFSIFFVYDTPCQLYKEGKIEKLKSFLRSVYRDESEVQNQIELIKEQVSLTTFKNEVDKEKGQTPLQKFQSNEVETQNKEEKNEHHHSQDIQIESSENHNAKKSYNRRFLLGFLMCVGQQLTCINGVIFYSNKIFEDANQEENAIYYSIGLQIIHVFAAFISSFIVDKKGRRPMMLWGTLLICFSLGLIALFLSLNLFILSYLAICLFLIAFALSQGPLVWAYQGEMLENKALQINTCALWVATLVIGIIFPYLVKAFKVGGTFAIFAVIVFLFLIYYKKEFIETKGKTRAQIYRDFCYKFAIQIQDKNDQQYQKLDLIQQIEQQSVQQQVEQQQVDQQQVEQQQVEQYQTIST